MRGNKHATFWNWQGARPNSIGRHHGETRAAQWGRSDVAPGEGVTCLLGGAVAILLALAWAALAFVDVNRFKPRLESAASRAQGMHVRFAGWLHVRLVPRLELTAGNGSVLTRQGATVATAVSAHFAISPVP